MITSNISRLQFLRGDFKGKLQILRPPWSATESEFIKHCKRCGECIKACPENILETGRGEYPQVNFQHGECTFCGLCADQCPNQTLQKDREIAWTASIKDNCLTQQGIVCFSCRDNCEREAISFTITKIPIPKIDSDLCNGCGACYQTCPVNAIIINRVVPE